MRKEFIGNRSTPTRFTLEWGSATRRLMGSAVLLWLSSHPLNVLAAQDFLLFPRINSVHISKADSSYTDKRNDLDPSINLFYSGEFDKWRIIGEYFYSEDEHEMERLQVGWITDSSTTIWFGRFHNPQGYWNTQHHHGAYLQTSISRPGIHAFEDEGGVMASHLTGFLIEGLSSSNDTWNVTLALGAGPTFETHLKPLDVLSPHDYSHKLSGTARLIYSPDGSSGTEVGVFASSTRITGDGPAIAEIKQVTSGVFGNWKWQETRLIGELFFVSDEVNNFIQTQSGSFTNAYLQVEHDWRSNWIVFARTEHSYGNSDDAYLMLFPEFIDKSNMVGLRYDFTRGQAIKLEFKRNPTFDQMIVQWSAVFP